VMDVRLVHMDLAKAGHLCANRLVTAPASKETKTALELNFIFERDLRPRKQTYGYIWFSDCRETPRDAVGKLRCHQLVSDFCRSTGDIVQAVVTHGDDLLDAPREPLTRNRHHSQIASSIQASGGLMLGRVV